MGQLNVAVIGCGVWGINHARVFSMLPDVKLAAISDIDANRAKYVSNLYGVNGFTDTLRVLKDSEIDAVSICTPTCTHEYIASRALEAGKHVLVEKPMTDTTSEARQLINSAKDQGVNLMVGFVERFNPAVRETKRLVDNGEIGEIILASAKRVTRRPERVGDIGVVKDLGIHDIDVVNYLMEKTPEKVYAHTGSIKHSYEDCANISLGFTGNRSASIETNWLTPERVRTLTVTGSEGIIEVEYTSQELKIAKPDYVHQPLNGFKEPLFLELQEFTSSILEKRPPEVTGVDGLNALMVCEAVLESSKTGKVVKLG